MVATVAAAVSESAVSSDNEECEHDEEEDEDCLAEGTGEQGCEDAVAAEVK